jgi:hypothetical protein
LETKGPRSIPSESTRRKRKGIATWVTRLRPITRPTPIWSLLPGGRSEPAADASACLGDRLGHWL